MTAPAFEEVPMPAPYLQRPITGDLYTADQLRAYGDQRANAALEEAAKRVEEMDRGTFRKRAGGMVEIGQGARDAVSDAIRALKKENGDAD